MSRRRLARTLLIAWGVLIAPTFAQAGHPSPADWRDQSIYQILTDRFFDGDPANNNADGAYVPSDGAKTHGGDWAGIEAKLDYIQGLGATTLWISPVQSNANGAYHGYHIQDFYGFAAQFGGFSALRSLIDEAHARGMYVILDVIANHGGDLIHSNDPGWPSFEDPGTYNLVWRNGGDKAAPPFDSLSWYHNNGEVSNWNDPEQILGEIFGLDDFRTEVPAIRDALIAAHQQLIDTTDADGFRIDTVKHVELDFWQEFGPGLHDFASDTLSKSDFFMYGEVFSGSAFENGKYTGTQAGGPFALDATLWFPMHFTTTGVFRDGGNTNDLSGVYGDSTFYDPTARERLVKFLDNHDVGRFMGFGSNADRDEARSKIAQAWLYTSIGIPCLYYGTEQEFDGGGDPWNREDMWDGLWDFGPSEGDNFHMAAPLYKWARNLNRLRSQLPALRRGSQEEVASSGSAGIYAYYRRLVGEETVLVILNTSESDVTLTIDPDLVGGLIHDGLSGASRTIPASGNVDYVLGGLSAAIWSAVQPDPAPWVDRTWPVHDGLGTELGAPISITFSEAMDKSSAENAVSVSPSFGYTTQWVGNTLHLLPSSPLTDGTPYEITIGRSAGSLADNDSLGVPFVWTFRTNSGASPSITLPAISYAADLPGDDLRVPLSLEAGRSGTPTEGRIILGDTGWDRVLFHDDNGFVEKTFDDNLIQRPAAIAQDVAGGLFSGDLLIADSQNILRAREAGDERGSIEVLAPLPSTGPDWVIAVDPTGRYGGLAYLGAPGVSTVYSVDEAGTVSTFATGLTDVNGLAFGLGAGFGTDLYVSRDDGSIFRIDSTGVSTLFVSDPGQLGGASALAFDETGGLGGGLFVASITSDRILRVTSGASVEVYANGFDPLAGGDCLAFDHLGNLYISETDHLVKISPLSITSGVVVDYLPPTHRFDLPPNRPNPFNPTTEIRFVVPGENGTVLPIELAIYDLAGRKVSELVSGDRIAGPHSITWDGMTGTGSPASTGIYFARFRAGAAETSRKIILIR